MRRLLPALLLILGLAPGTWLHEGPRPQNDTVAIRFDRVALPPRSELARDLGAFELEQVWNLVSPNTAFGGYSALLPQPGGRLLAISDNAAWFAFSPPGTPPAPPAAGLVLSAQRKKGRDIESATQDPHTGAIWTAREDANSISRQDRGFGHLVTVRPPEMRDWTLNFGPESMVRLADGRFVVLSEERPFGDGVHRAVMFARDPLSGDAATRFTFVGEPGFNPTDMAALPDGRVLILLRRLIWPLPLRFTGRIMIADPAAIRPGSVWRGVEVARLTSAMPTDNFEGMAIEPRADGRVTVWLISDSNYAATQRTLLWKLAVDPQRLPRTGSAQARKKARE